MTEQDLNAIRERAKGKKLTDDVHALLKFVGELQSTHVNGDVPKENADREIHDLRILGELLRDSFTGDLIGGATVAHMAKRLIERLSRLSETKMKAAGALQASNDALQKEIAGYVQRIKDLEKTIATLRR